MKNDFFVAECYATGCRVEFYINNIPIASRCLDGSPFWGGPVNQYIKPGKNIISVKIESDSKSSNQNYTLKKPISGEAVYMKISTYPKSEMIGGGNGKELARIEWPLKYVTAQLFLCDNKLIGKSLFRDKTNNQVSDPGLDRPAIEKTDIILPNNICDSFQEGDIVDIKLIQMDPVSQLYKGEIIRMHDNSTALISEINNVNDFILTSFPLMQSKVFKAPMGIHKKAWQKSKKIKLTSKTIEQAGKSTEDLHQIIETGNYEKFITISNKRIIDNCLAYSTDILNSKEQIIEAFKRNLSKEVELEPLEPENFNFRLCANRRLIHCTMGSNRPVIKEVPDNKGDFAYYDFFIGKYQRKWRVLL